MIRRLYNHHKRKINYLLVGGWNTVFGYGLFAGLFFLLSAKLHYVIILLVGYPFSVTNAYIGYKTFVFQTKGNYLKEYLKFQSVYLVALAFNLVFLPLVVEVAGLHPVAAQGVFTITTFICSYVGHKYFSFAS